MALPGEIGWIGKNCPDHPTIKLQTKAMRSAAGWFVATQCPECRLEDPSPFSRESAYYPTREEVVAAMFNETIRWRDTAFHPGPLTLIEPHQHTCKHCGQVWSCADDEENCDKTCPRCGESDQRDG